MRHFKPLQTICIRYACSSALYTVQCIDYHDHHHDYHDHNYDYHDHQYDYQDHHYDYHDHHHDYHIFYQRLKEHMHETTVSQFNIAENVADLYKEKQV